MAAAELYGDWHRDPWSWPELNKEWASALDAEGDLRLIKRTSGQYHLELQPSFHLIDVPKTRLGMRPAVVIDPASRLAYLAAVASGLEKLHADLPEWVYGWRSRGDIESVTGNVEWDLYVADLPPIHSNGHGLLTDITSFFASIEPRRVDTAVRARLGNVAATSVIMDVIEAHDALFTRSGLPQRSFGSAVIAHVVAQPLDDSVRAALAQSGVHKARRWMDDVSAEGDEEALFSLLVSLQENARLLGLELNASKTHLAAASDTAAALRLEDLRRIQVPKRIVGGGDYSEVRVIADPEALLRLEDEIIKSPLSTSRTIARAVLSSLTEHGLFGRHPEWLQIAHQLPHGADTLGRFIRGAMDSNPSVVDACADWFIHYVRSAWGKVNWVTTQYALAFPSASIPPPVREVLLNWLTVSSDLQQLGVAAQRISASEPGVARNLIRARTDRTNDPLILRTFALALLGAGEDRNAVRSLLTRDLHNRLLVKRLEGLSWAPIQVSKDFDAPLVEP